MGTIIIDLFIDIFQLQTWHWKVIYFNLLLISISMQMMKNIYRIIAILLNLLFTNM